VEFFLDRYEVVPKNWTVLIGVL